MAICARLRSRVTFMLMNGFSIPDTTLAAYRAAIYRIHGEPPIDMKIGEKNASVAALLGRHGVASAVFVTAFNPFGCELSAEQNAARQRALEAYIAQAGWMALAGEGLIRTMYGAPKRVCSCSARPCSTPTISCWRMSRTPSWSSRVMGCRGCACIRDVGDLTECFDAARSDAGEGRCVSRDVRRSGRA